MNVYEVVSEDEVKIAAVEYKDDENDNNGGSYRCIEDKMVDYLVKIATNK